MADGPAIPDTSQPLQSASSSTPTSYTHIFTSVKLHDVLVVSCIVGAACVPYVFMWRRVDALHRQLAKLSKANTSLAMEMRLSHAETARLAEQIALASKPTVTLPSQGATSSGPVQVKNASYDAHKTSVLDPDDVDTVLRRLEALRRWCRDTTWSLERLERSMIDQSAVNNSFRRAIEDIAVQRRQRPPPTSLQEHENQRKMLWSEVFGKRLLSQISMSDEHGKGDIGAKEEGSTSEYKNEMVSRTHTSSV